MKLDYFSLTYDERSLLVGCLNASLTKFYVAGRIDFDGREFLLIDGPLRVETPDRKEKFEITTYPIDLDAELDFSEQDVGTLELFLSHEALESSHEREVASGNVRRIQIFKYRMSGAARSLDIRHTLVFHFQSGGTIAASAWPNFYTAVSSDKEVIARWIDSSASVLLAEELLG